MNKSEDNPPVITEDNALVETKQPKLLVRRSKLDHISFDTITAIYATGANHRHAAKKLGVSEEYWSRVRNGSIQINGTNYEGLCHAIEKGQAQIADTVLANLVTQSKKQAIPALFLAKQEHILGFRDERKVEVGGSITIKFEETTSGEVIDITPDDD